jgi:hypothetical protein
VRQYREASMLGFPLLVGEAGAVELMRRLGNKAGGLPFTVLVDAAGRVRQRKLGAYSADGLAADLERLLR